MLYTSNSSNIKICEYKLLYGKIFITKKTTCKYENVINQHTCCRASSGSPSQLFSTLMILKAACMHNAQYIDRLITTFMKVLHKMAREHLAPSTPETSPGELILQLSIITSSSYFNVMYCRA